MKHIIGDTRVSTAEQAMEGVGLEMQARKIDSDCDVKDWQLSEVMTDAGESAKSLNRPGMVRLLGMVEAAHVSTVIVYKLDRLTRSVADLDRLVKLFEKKNVALVSLQESLDATTATGRLMMNLLASVSQWEREVIGERTKDTMAELTATGQVYCRPRIDDPDLMTWLLNERRAGRSHGELAAELNSRHVPMARGGQWEESTIRKLLKRLAA